MREFCLDTHCHLRLGFPTSLLPVVFLTKRLQQQIVKLSDLAEKANRRNCWQRMTCNTAGDSCVNVSMCQ